MSTFDDTTGMELFEQGRHEMIDTIAHAETYSPQARAFWTVDADEAQHSHPWHRVVSILFAEGTPGTTEWMHMDTETRERLAGRMQVLMDFVLAGAEAEERRRDDLNSGDPASRLHRWNNLGKPLPLHEIMPELFPAPQEDATIAMMDAEYAIHGNRSPHDAGHVWGD